MESTIFENSKDNEEVKSILEDLKDALEESEKEQKNRVGNQRPNPRTKSQGTSKDGSTPRVRMHLPLQNIDSELKEERSQGAKMKAFVKTSTDKTTSIVTKMQQKHSDISESEPRNFFDGTSDRDDKTDSGHAERGKGDSDSRKGVRGKEIKDETNEITGDDEFNLKDPNPGWALGADALLFSIATAAALHRFSCPFDHPSTSSSQANRPCFKIILG